MAEEMDEMREIVNDFVTETDELIGALDNDLIALENSPDDLDLINKIFRAVHTVKGAAGFLGFTKMVDVVHRTENVLNKCRQGELKVTPRINDVILRAVDVLKTILDNIRNSEESTMDIAPLLAELEVAATPEGEAPASLPPAPMGDAVDLSSLFTKKPEEAPAAEMPRLGELLINELKITPEQLSEALEEQEKAPKLGEILVKKHLISQEDLDQALKKQPKPSTQAVAQEQTIRVDIERLDEVMNLVGELVLGRNRILQIGTELEHSYENDPRVQSLMDTVSQINMVTSDLQLAVMKTRMQPVKRVFNRFPRMVRDLAKSIGKEINLVILGEETELDKSVIEEIGDPLVHLVRNGVDHGMETPDEREAMGKPREGTLTLAAFYEGNNIMIEVRDDGKGMDPERLVAKAIAKGVIQEADVERMTEKDKINLIYAPGFSTAERVSDISGRGVGMDVVRTNIVKLNGTINTQTELGKGTTISIRLPLTVAIIQTLMVGVGRETFALPLASVVETVRTSVESIQYMDMQEVIHLREEVLPLVRLSDIFSVEVSEAAGVDSNQQWLYVVVIAIAEKKVGIVVESLLGQEEVVIKSLGKYIRPKGIAGATILGNGKVTLIVDLGGLMDVIDEMRINKPAPRKPKKKIAERSNKTILVVDDSAVARMNQKRALEAAGYNVIEAEHGLDGLEKLKANPGVSMIVTDMLMPALNGAQMTARIKADERFKGIGVIALTVAEDEKLRSEGFRAGIDEFFYKNDLSGMLESVKKRIG
ncbi:MAG: hybrid sensor histidine kinase/response regulator [Nitrospinae bacterium]|nr:hybrid sensor histidine kinase/response regulator [Nitrospinota bacterium]